GDGSRGSLVRPAGVPRRHRPRRGADGRHLLPGAATRRAAVRRGGGRGRPRPDALHPGGDEADERGQGGCRGGRPRNPRRQCGVRGVRPASFRTGTDQRNAAGTMNLRETVAPAKAGTASRRHRKLRPKRPSAGSLMFSRVLVANRGEIAVRVIRALHELEIEAVAIYSSADKESMHVRLADRAVAVGPPSASQSYLNIPSVIAAATTTGCEAIHPGYGFLAENPAFVAACEDNELVFVGPTAEVMARMGDKVQAKAEMKRADVPVVPGSDEAVAPAEARLLAAELGYPVLLKAAAGGGGKGMRIVDAEDELEGAFQTAAAEADAAFGDPSLYV